MSEIYLPGCVLAGKWLVCSTENRTGVLCRNLLSKQPVWSRVCSGGIVIGLQAARNGKKLAVNLLGGQLEVLNGQGKRLFSLPGGPLDGGLEDANITTMAFSAGGVYLAVAKGLSGGSVCGVWSLHTGEQVFEKRTILPVQTLFLFREGRVLVTVHNQAIQAWDMKNDSREWEMTYPIHPVICAAASSDEKIIAIGSSDGAYLLHLDDFEGRSHLYLPEEKMPVRRLSFSNRGDKLAVLAGLGTVVLWSKLAESRLLTRLPEEIYVNSVGFSQDDQTLLLGTSGCRLRSLKLPDSLSDLPPIGHYK